MIDERIKIIGFFLGHIGRTLKTKLSKAFMEAGYDLGAEHFSILMYLSKRPGVNQQELADNIFKEKTTAVRLLDLLEAKKYIQRVRDENDRRNNLIYITEEGKNAKESLVSIVSEHTSNALAGLSEDELESLTLLLKKIYRNINPDSENFEFLNKCGE